MSQQRPPYGDLSEKRCLFFKSLGGVVTSTTRKERSPMQEADSTLDTAPGQFDAVTFDDIIARYRASKEYGPDWAERHAEAVIARVRQACEAEDYAYLHSLRY